MCCRNRRLWIVVMAMLLALPATGIAAPALRPDIVNSLETMQQRLADGNGADVADSAYRAAERLKGGNSADRWARALFLQLAANGEMQQSNDARAAELLAIARRTEEADPEWRRQCLRQEARLRLRAGQTSQGAELLARWLAHGDGDADDMWLMAQASASQNAWSEAASWVDRARQATASPSAERLNLAASVYQRAGRSDEALDALGALLDRDREDPDNWRRAAGLAQRLDRPGQAAAIWESAWRRDVLTTPEDLRQLILLHLAGGTPARAAEYLSEALQQDVLPDNLQNLRLLAQAWSAARDRQKALQAWHQVAERSNAPDDWRRLGELAYGWGDWQVAVDAFGQARGVGEAGPRQWLLEGIAWLELNSFKAAQRAFEAARQAGSAEAQAWLATLENTSHNAAPASSVDQG